MSEHVGLTQSDALSKGGEGLGESSEGLWQQLGRLIEDMDKDSHSLQGNALQKFRQARGELTQRFDELMTWCSNNGIKLNEGQKQVNTTDTESGDDFGSAGNQLGGLSRPVNG
ncbi:hypothetical protein CDO52_03975 [Nocardiopsis gilva YIM 90087]|uniref:Uncharacterized protein n=1 Tax=Nocardiopsis gilva YIM 90087 TaxID=1235441 RepID=A0A223S1P6_9ACTN|nr:hypothetical protein [Nocardiopsis gilva]ASU82050.1 hypothetical protein CDO52_03975 [Nocardiopsis gilva YIM 90087]